LEIRINKEIRDYTESVFFGLSLRQTVFSALACCVAAGLYFILKPSLGTETLSWLCILGAAPFGALGFIRYNGMNAEQVLCAYIKSEWLMPRTLCFKAGNVYLELLDPRRMTRKERKEWTKAHAENA
jgi:hypothetical protein